MNTNNCSLYLLQYKSCLIRKSFQLLKYSLMMEVVYSQTIFRDVMQRSTVGQLNLALASLMTVSQMQPVLITCSRFSRRLTETGICLDIFASEMQLCDISHSLNTHRSLVVISPCNNQIQNS